MGKSDEKRIRKAARIAAGVFAREGWRYVGGDVPDADYLEDQVIRHLLRMVDEYEDCTCVSTGRIRVERTAHSKEIYLHLGEVEAPERSEFSA